jgi:hypothetical protein
MLIALKLNYFLRKLINPLAIPILEVIAGDIDNYLPYPFNEELKGSYLIMLLAINELIYRYCKCFWNKSW